VRNQPGRGIECPSSTSKYLEAYVGAMALLALIVGFGSEPVGAKTSVESTLILKGLLEKQGGIP
jgi:hypothetical protein